METAIGNLASASTLTGVVPALTNGNGTTFNVDKVDLGGELTQTTAIDVNTQALSFDSDYSSLLLGDSPYGNISAFVKSISPTEITVGGIVGIGGGDNSYYGRVDLTDSAPTTLMVIEPTSGNVRITTNDDFLVTSQNGVQLDAAVSSSLTAGSLTTGNNILGSSVLLPNASSPAVGQSLKKNEDYEVGFFAIGGTTPFANIYYGVLDSDNNITDTSRLEANENEVHGRKFITVGGNYNGFHANTTYAQLEFNKVTEDGQTTGTVWVLDADGAALYVGGTMQFRIKNSVPSYADDAAAAGGGLVTGDVYKTTTAGSTFLKIVP